MNEIFLNHLPHCGNRIDWVRSIGYTIKYCYNDLHGYLNIIDYNAKQHTLTVQCDFGIFPIRTDAILKCHLGNILFTHSDFYRYNSGDIIKTNTGYIEIFDRIKIKTKSKYPIKGYTYQCLIDGYIGKIKEREILIGRGCSVCNNKKVMHGINDIWTTAPEIAKLLVNPEDGYKYTKFSNKCADFKCPNCGNIVHKKISDVATNGEISYCCKHKTNHAGKLSDGTKLVWMYYDEYIKQCKIEKIT